MTLSATLRELAAKATLPPWRSVMREAGRRELLVIESAAFIDEEPGVCGPHSSQWPLSPEDAALIVALVNHAPLIAAALALAEVADRSAWALHTHEFTEARAGYRAARGDR